MLGPLASGSCSSRWEAQRTELRQRTRLWHLPGYPRARQRTQSSRPCFAIAGVGQPLGCPAGVTCAPGLGPPPAVKWGSLYRQKEAVNPNCSRLGPTGTKLEHPPLCLRARQKVGPVGREQGPLPACAGLPAEATARPLYADSSHGAGPCGQRRPFKARHRSARLQVSVSGLSSPPVWVWGGWWREGPGRPPRRASASTFQIQLVCSLQRNSWLSRKYFPNEPFHRPVPSMQP